MNLTTLRCFLALVLLCASCSGRTETDGRAGAGGQGAADSGSGAGGTSTSTVTGGSTAVGGSTGVGGGNGGTGNIGGGTCFPGAKVCPDPQTGQLICLGSNVPENGCIGSAACNPCQLPHAVPTCSPEGKCVPASCDAVFADCNGNPSDGCETNIAFDATNCGACGISCLSMNGVGWVCGAGVCQINECCPTGAPSCSGYRNCDGDKSNACEVDTATDANNCGACGNVCDLANAEASCALGTCQVLSCDPGYADCDGVGANGCETSLTNDANHCGACGASCASPNSAPACVNGVCQCPCFTGYADCDGVCSGNGCETHLANDVKSCGACGFACAPGKICQMGKCQ